MNIIESITNMRWVRTKKPDILEQYTEIVKEKTIGIPIAEPEIETVQLLCDDEDAIFTGDVYWSCPCGKFFGHREHIPVNMICPQCGKRLKFYEGIK